MIKSKVPFLLFFISGFCGLLYQVIWLRLAFRSFGVITPVLSIVISVFMLGLALGSWVGGRWISSSVKRSGVNAIYYYAAAELFIGIGAFLVPLFFLFSENFLLRFGELDSFLYLFISAVLIALSILPWCILMGTTYPFMMAFLKKVDYLEESSFSFLYLANVIGAMCGTLITAFILIELIGFSKTLLLAGCANFLIAVISYFLGRSSVSKISAPAEPPIQPVAQTLNEAATANESPFFYMAVLFITGFSSIGLEVVWTRAFTPVLKTTIYAFASLVAVYLFATWVGSYAYRRNASVGKALSNTTLLALLALSAFLPVIINDPRINMSKLPLLATIVPFCGVLGYLTPKLIDEYGRGFPAKAGKAYAVNIIGCILGPLVASYIMLPLVGTTLSMALLGAPFVVLLLSRTSDGVTARRAKLAFGSVSIVFFLWSLVFSVGYEERFGTQNYTRDGIIRRDHTATIISFGKGDRKQLLVNGIGITKLTIITKMMAHWPLAHLKKKPESALVICFGMGTTYRSLMTWPIKVTAVELVPSVKDAFGYYHDDAQSLLDDPRGKIIIDDGRRFLRRTKEKFDVITIDPAPPVEAAGTSLLYSREFLEIVKDRLTDGGILQHWLATNDMVIFEGVTRALIKTFPYVRAYRGAKGWGVHYLASTRPFNMTSVDAIIKNIPAKARADIQEWDVDRYTPLEETVGAMLATSADFSVGVNPLRDVSKETDIVITDDRPYNEYYILRRLFAKQ